jgi:hypothetical protein
MGEEYKLFICDIHYYEKCEHMWLTILPTT